MNEREANIDLLFRNGLKDYEVLPPVEAWDKIGPAIRKQNRAYFILRVAAMIAVLVTLGFLSITYNNQVADKIALSGLNQAPEIMSPGTLTPEPRLIAEASGTQPASLAGKNRNSWESAGNAVISDEREVSGTLARKIENPGLESSETVYDRSKLISIRSKANKETISAFLTPDYTGDIPVAEKKERWSIAALVSPTYMSNFQTKSSEAVRQLGTAEQPVISYSGGLALSYNVSRRLSVQSGLYYASYGNELTGISAYGGFNSYDQMKGNSNFEVQTVSGKVATSNSDVYLVDNISNSRVTAYFDSKSFDPSTANLEYMNGSLRQNLGYLELPLILRYKLVDGTFDFNIVGGLSSNMLVSNSVYAPINGGRYEVGKTEGLNTFIFSSSLGMGMEYSFTRNFSFNLEPTLRYYLNPFSNTSGLGVHPYSFGIFSGISYRF